MLVLHKHGELLYEGVTAVRPARALHLVPLLAYAMAWMSVRGSTPRVPPPRAL